ncbi:MAG: hypothetical protein E6568_01585 [Rothia mucilaginosa]|uniref:hypothetical protein n=1 Tax=Rothia sp. (in: high G+C Gram-positive bacteria) TaxID=1885016 RepID=UPI0025E1345D|nr:hypothetical protein [Rothia sp. (in: high G+C Gram-positive bacteria)]MDU6365737.1 hypothetical protein [Rothia mucilaginosa]
MTWWNKGKYKGRGPRPHQETKGLSYEARWQLIQHFTEWIKHGDMKIQMLLTVQGVIVAAYGAFLPSMLPSGDKWNSCLVWLFLFVNLAFVYYVRESFKIGFEALRPNTKQSPVDDKGTKPGDNIFYYGFYSTTKIQDSSNLLGSISEDEALNSINRQIFDLGKIAKEKFDNVSRLQVAVYRTIFWLFGVFVVTTWFGKL